MKNKRPLLLLFLSACLCFAASCKKTPVNPNVDQLSQLPPATQTGANTFGCLVNGQAFLPHANAFTYTSGLQCNYIYNNGGYYFSVAASTDENPSYNVLINVGTNLLAIQEGQTLKLENNSVSKANAEYDLIPGAVITYTTTTIVGGQLHITKFDQIKQIVSGTFYFNAINSSKPDTIHVTDGRFDMRYTL